MHLQDANAAIDARDRGKVAHDIEIEIIVEGLIDWIR